MVSSAPNPRPVHPCYLSVWEGAAGAEFSTWARISNRSLSHPDLVTAQASTLKVYSIDEPTGKLLLVHTFPCLAGNVCFLASLPVPATATSHDADDNDNGYKNSASPSDALLIGFAGHPRLSLVTVKQTCPKLLLATTLFDLTPALTDACQGAVTPMEQDLQASVLLPVKRKNATNATVSVLLGGGVVIACLELKYTVNEGWRATSDEPYVLPLQTLSSRYLLGEKRILAGNPASAAGANAAASNPAVNKDLTQSIMTGFGDMLSIEFLPGYLEPTLVLLHSNPTVGWAWPGRLGRQDGGTRYGLLLTSISVSVRHQRSAILWSTEVPADAISVHSCGASNGCLVICCNSIIAVSNTGQVQQCLAVNGWVDSTLTFGTQSKVQANPWPFPKLSISLDGSHVRFVQDTTAFIVLRSGQIYLLQYTSSWSLMPLYATVGAVGQVSTLSCCPLGKMSPSATNSMLATVLKTKQPAKTNDLDIGLMFVGSRLGDSSLAGYSLELTTLADAMEKEPSLRSSSIENRAYDEYRLEDQDHERILQLEEDALYDTTSEQVDKPTIVPQSDDESMGNADPNSSQPNTRKRARLSHLVVVNSLTVLDSLTALGPLGAACSGPISRGPIVSNASRGMSLTTGPAPLGALGYVAPCGYGSSGGLALLTVPGRDDRSILAEQDCVNADAIFSLPSHGLIYMTMSEGQIRLLKLEKADPSDASTSMKSETNVQSSTSEQDEESFKMSEVDILGWCGGAAANLFYGSKLLAAEELNENDFVMLLATMQDVETYSYFAAVLSDVSGRGVLKASEELLIPLGVAISSTTPLCKTDSNTLTLGLVLSTGECKALIVTADGMIKLQSLPIEPPQIPMEEGDDEAATADIDEVQQYYAVQTISSVDLFKAPEGFFPKKTPRNEAIANAEKPSRGLSAYDAVLDDDDNELYGTSSDGADGKLDHIDGVTKSEESNVPMMEDQKEGTWFFSLTRQSGKIEIFKLSDLVNTTDSSEPIWESIGCSHGVPTLSYGEPKVDPAYRAPRMHKVQTSEHRFFFCGPALKRRGTRRATPNFPGPSVFCLAVETSDGDTLLYSADFEESALRVKSFSRVQLKYVTRPSQEQGKHFAKLRRKGIVGNRDMAGHSGFRHNRLFRFTNISGQDGLFAAVARPVWFIAERGRPTFLCHRSRHAAPAGARQRPVTGFCSGLLDLPSLEPGFMTLHERVGRVGSQRLTVFSSILNMSHAHGIVPGGGLFVEKIPLGVTVRRIQFIDDSDCNASSPLYVVLVSRELEVDLSSLNDDGLTAEERRRQHDEKENEKVKRQVEADLGGFDIEQEWVEEIEREDCFKVDTELGGAPPIHKSAYSLWIVNAANGWMVVDSYEFDEFEHAMTMEVMTLSEFTSEPGISNVEALPEDMENKSFIVVGTGMVGKDGEDVSSRGRVLLFELGKTSSSPSQPAELNLTYEKPIFHGPVTTVSCLSSESKHRLVIGAGADVNVEQWGNDKLTQVGFFRATMQILDIKLFKNFFVLSDAYDSLYFLVWRESDKSLTLLAKDYDPISVYATGLLSRGGSLDLVCHDDRQNLQFFQYAPGDAAARGGNKLVCRADFHLGSQTTDLQNHFCRSSLLVNSATPNSTLAALKQQDTFFGRTDDDQRLGINFGTTDGVFGSIAPVGEPVYWRLTALQSVMVNALESDCALSHRAWRLYRRTPRRGGCRSNDRKKGVIDGDFVMQYADLSVSDQEDLASAIGSTVGLILDNLLELKCSAMLI